MIAITTGTIYFRKAAPWLLAGWLWYLGMLVPVIGFVQVGIQSHADRYTYLPQIGLILGLGWTVGALAKWLPVLRNMAVPVSVALLLNLMIAARAQTAYWHDSTSLWTQTLACTDGNYLAHDNLGSALCEKGDVAGAIAHYEAAIQIKPDYEIAENNLGLALLRADRPAEAVRHFQRALKIKPDYAKAENNLGNGLLKLGRMGEAADSYRKAIQLAPDYPEAHANLGNTLLKMGKVDEAIASYFRAVELRPGYAKAHTNLASALLRRGRAREAVGHLEQALAVQPNYAIAQSSLAWVLATSSDASLRNGARAVDLALAAQRAGPANLCVLAAAYAEAGRFSEAAATAREAIRFAESQGNAPRAEALRNELGSYEAKTPWRENIPANP